jgi:Periplasmic binding protein
MTAVASPAARICSLLPGATEIVGALGLADALVAVSEECDWPPQVRGLPMVTASRVDTRRLSGLEIDRAVRDAVRDGRPLYAIDQQILEAADPDIILTQNLCAVCAVSADNVNELCATRAEIVALDAHTIRQIEERVVSLAELLQVPERGEAVVAEMRRKIAAVRERVADEDLRPISWRSGSIRRSRPDTGCRRWWHSPAAATCSGDRARRRIRLRGRPSPSYGPSSSLLHHAASTTSARPGKHVFRRSIAVRSRSTQTPTTRGRRRGLPMASRSSPFSSTRI